MKTTIAKDFQSLLPALTAEEFDLLKKNNLEDPNHERIPPVVIWKCGKEWIVVDGHHTLKARQSMRINGRPAKIRYHKMEFEDREIAKAYALRAQLGRRNLSASQLAMVISQVPTVPRSANLHFGEKPEENGDFGPTRQELAKEHGVSERTIKHADKVKKQGAKAIEKAVSSGKIKVSDAASIADLPKKDQVEALKKVTTGKAKTLKQAAPKKKKPKGKPPKQYPRSHWIKQWHNTIGPPVRIVDTIAEAVGELNSREHKLVHALLSRATEELTKWMEVNDEPAPF